jgi:hypothetical protein
MPHTSTTEERNERSPLLARHQSFLSESASSISIVSSSTLGTGSSDNCPSRSFPKPPTDEESHRVSDAAAGDSQRPSTASVARIVIVLLIGVFISNADGSLVLATHPVIASEFNDLSDSSWLFNSFALASAATQSLYGKLSDIYGRKVLVLVAYALFALGWFVLNTSVNKNS